MSRIVLVKAGGKVSRLEMAAYLLGLSLLWLLFYGPIIGSPWIGGFDSVSRLYHIDKTVVSILGNPWLPLLQLLLQAVSFISDTPQAYKLLVGVFALGGMLLAFYLLADTFHPWVAILFSLGLLLSDQWKWISTSIYMEALCFFCCAAALVCWRRGERFGTALFFILATFSRPELLMAAPFMTVFHLWYFRSWRRSLAFAACFVPVIVFYLGLNLQAGTFEVPAAYSWEVAERLWWKLSFALRASWFYRLAVLLALGGVVVVWWQRDFLAEQRRWLLGLLPVVLAFWLLFVFGLPVLHGFSPGGTRPTLLLVLPVVFYAALFCWYWQQRYPQALDRILLVLTAVLLTARYPELRQPVPWSYENAQKILRELEQAGQRPPGPLLVCTLADLEEGQGGLHALRYEPLLLYMRFAGWRFEIVDCWEGVPAGGKKPLLRFYDRETLDPKMALKITKDCSRTVKLRKGRRVYGQACF